MIKLDWRVIARTDSLTWEWFISYEEIMYELTSNSFICLIKVLTIDVDADRSSHASVCIYNKNQETWHDKQS